MPEYGVGSGALAIWPDLEGLEVAQLGAPRAARRLEARAIPEAIAATFAHRDTHSIPTALQDPPESWKPTYEALALEDELAWKTIAEVVAAARGFLNPVLGSDVDVVWEPTSWEWRSR